MTLALILLLGILPSAACQAADAHAPAASVEQVLAIAASGDANAKAQLEAIADTDRGTVTSALAGTILMRWRDDLNTYVSKDAMYLSYKPQVPPVKAFAFVQVEVDEAGKARSVTFLRIDQPEHRTEIEQFFLSRTYLPARRDGAYVSGTTVVSIKPEVR